jgi:glycosyltransferase involved in cell wall biosynthesis
MKDEKNKIMIGSSPSSSLPTGEGGGRGLSLSIILPIYKAEKYLNRCIESILMQKVEDMEIILVDDGSPDKSGELCDEWALKDERIRVIHKQNGGPGSARNRALDIAKGTYVTFIDSDDAISENTFLPIINYLHEHQDIDIIEYPAHLYIGSSKERKLTFENAIFDISDIKDKQSLWLDNKLYAHCYSCNKVFRRSLFDGLRYSESVTLGEDIRLISQLLKKAHTYATINTGMYLYYFNGESISGSLKFADELLFSHLYAVDQLGIDIYSKASRYLYLTMLNFQIDVYRFGKTTPAEPMLKKASIPLNCARNKKELIKILLMRIFGVKGLCCLYSSL